jgi:hypothetical protein
LLSGDPQTLLLLSPAPHCSAMQLLTLPLRRYTLKVLLRMTVV